MYLRILLLLLTLWTVCEADNDDSMTCKEKQPAISKIVNSLSSRLAYQIGGSENYFYSPLSISVALAMVFLGARGATRDQMAEALQYKTVGKNCLSIKVGEEFRDLIFALENENDDYSLLIANGVFIHNDYKISEYYSSNLRKFFRSTVQFLNFVEEQQLTMERINEWVSNYTKGKVKKVLNEPLDPMTVMVLMNAVYFKGVWEYPFEERSTWDSFFYRQNGTSKIVSFMLLQEVVKYYLDMESNYTFLELNYAGGNVSMLLILPKSSSDFPTFDLTSEALCDIRNKLKPENAMVILPKFKMEYRRELSKDMMKLGIEELFFDRADLTGIREQNDLHVSLMIHKAVIDVNEQGSEAAGLSGVGIDGRRKVGQVTFWADHPFLFYIIHKETNTVLFTGRVTDP